MDFHFWPPSLEQFTPIPPIATKFLQRIAEACTSTHEKDAKEEGYTACDVCHPPR